VHAFSRSPRSNGTPTEREARVALKDFISGLAVISERLIAQARTRHLVITLGAEGALINAMVDGQLKSDCQPAFNWSKDASGVGRGTVLVNREWFQNETFLVAHADNLADFVVAGLIAAHRD
jgi:hypothetical protein